METIKIKTDNAAFAEDFGGEISRILRQIADDYEQNNVRSTYNDINGNKVATVS